MTDKPIIYSAGGALPRILTARGQKVILDADLAAIYGVPTKVFNQAVKRNRKRFPADFMFQLQPQEVKILTSQIAMSSAGGNRSQIVTASAIPARSRSQFVTLKRGQNIKYLPHAFTEHGAVMAANILRSPRAVQMSVFVVRAFIMMREQLLDRAELEKRLAQIEKALTGHDAALRDLYQKIRPLLLPALSRAEGPPPEPPRKQIGFHACPPGPAGRRRVKEASARYQIRARRKSR